MLNTFRSIVTRWYTGEFFEDLLQDLRTGWLLADERAKEGEPEASLVQWAYRLFYDDLFYPWASTPWFLAVKSGVRSLPGVITTLRARQEFGRLQIPDADNIALLLELVEDDALVDFFESWQGLYSERAMFCLVQRLVSSGHVQEARQLITQIKHPAGRSAALGVLMPHLSEEERAEDARLAWEASLSFTQPEALFFMIEAFSELVLVMPPPMDLAYAHELETLMDWIPENSLGAWQGNDDLRLAVAKALAAAGDTTKALEWLRRVPKDHRAHCFGQAIPFFPASLQSEIFEEALPSLFYQDRGELYWSGQADLMKVSPECARRVLSFMKARLSSEDFLLIECDAIAYLEAPQASALLARLTEAARAQDAEARRGTINALIRALFEAEALWPDLEESALLSFCAVALPIESTWSLGVLTRVAPSGAFTDLLSSMELLIEREEAHTGQDCLLFLGYLVSRASEAWRNENQPRINALTKRLARWLPQLSTSRTYQFPLGPVLSLYSGEELSRIVKAHYLKEQAGVVEKIRVSIESALHLPLAPSSLPVGDIRQTLWSSHSYQNRNQPSSFEGSFQVLQALSTLTPGATSFARELLSLFSPLEEHKEAL